MRGIAAGLDVRLEFVTPQRWKRTVLDGTAKDKEAAIAYCRRAFPDVSLLPTPRSTKMHDGIADALCIASYALRTYTPHP